ncbi:DUF4249 family protein [Costertonia aggregata]|uniref:DUF4249 family protein n=1 Tax=Costertonia aggregata TaxID=343403 RepID=A0A7H9AKL5_9FLAO|nr:DUF4249 family protein [Costertonia aggregata]QLG43883.1 DUF4249 family protein [Costertonia aggregata]
MRKLIKIFFLSLLFFGCEDVIDIDTPSEPPRLVVDGILRVNESEDFIPVEIKFSLTNNFFEPIENTSVENAIIIIEEFSENGTIIDTRFSNLYEENPGSGIYVPNPNFSSDQRIPTTILQKNIRFTLLVEFRERIYAARTEYAKAPRIDMLEQRDGNLFGEDEVEIAVTFTDIPNEDNFYGFDFGFNEFLPTEDTFYKGEQFEFSYFYDNNLEPGTELEISILGSDIEWYNYMNLIVAQSDGNQGPFQTPVSTIRGNIFDITDIDNIDSFDNVEATDTFALGYFAVVQEFKQTILIE